MVAFAGRRYAARSPPAFVANSSYIVTSFTLVRTKKLASTILFHPRINHLLMLHLNLHFDVGP